MTDRTPSAVSAIKGNDFVSRVSTLPTIRIVDNPAALLWFERRVKENKTQDVVLWLRNLVVNGVLPLTA